MHPIVEEEIFALQCVRAIKTDKYHCFKVRLDDYVFWPFPFVQCLLNLSKPVLVESAKSSHKYSSAGLQV